MGSPSSDALLCDLGQRGDAVLAPYVTIFMCANCARPSKTPDSASRSRPELPAFDWPFPVQEVLVGCTGRVQPEHVLKAFESGARLVCIVACREDNCHYLEGSTRCARRVDYVRGILDEVGLGSERLLLFHLQGTAAEDTALSAGRPVAPYSPDAGLQQAAAIRESVLQVLENLTPTPLDISNSEAVQDPYQQVDTSYDDNED
jgi:coenzyme F420-reducing hydrogenase delta subunit